MDVSSAMEEDGGGVVDGAPSCDVSVGSVGDLRLRLRLSLFMVYLLSTSGRVCRDRLVPVQCELVE